MTLHAAWKAAALAIRVRSSLVVLAALAVGATAAFGAPKNKLADGLSWTNPSGWETGSVPGNEDTAVLQTGNAIVNGNVSVGAINLSGGGIGGTGTLTVVLTGSEWKSSSVMSFTGNSGITFGLATGSVPVDLLISETGNHDFDGTTLINTINGTFNWTAGTLRSGNGGSITNAGVFNDTSSNTIANAFTGEFTFTNTGIYNKAGSGTTDIQAKFSNTGTVNIAAGTLLLSGGGTSAGIVNVGSEAILEISSDVAVNSGSSFIGDGIMNFVSGTITLNAIPAAMPDTFNWTGGTITGAADFGVPSGGIYNWSGGTLTGSGAGLVAAGGTLNIADGNPTISRSVFGNAGLVNFDPSTGLTLGTGTAFVNSGVWNLTGDKIFSVGTDSHSFTNETGGILHKSSGMDTFTFNIPAVNAGTIASNSGTLAFTSTFTNNDGALVLSGGSLSFGNSIDLQMGTLIGAGTVTINNGGTLTTGGFVSPGSDIGLLTFDGSLTLLSTATLYFQIGGTTPITTHDHIDVTNLATLSGQLLVSFENGFTPSSSDTFVLMHAGGFSGSFTNGTSGSRLVPISNVGSFLVSYGEGSPFGSDALMLSDFQAVPEPSTYVLMLLGAAGVILRLRRRS